MRTFDRYILKELAGPFFSSLLVSSLILAAGNIIQTIDMIINKGVEPMYVIKIFLYFLPYVLIFTIPISVLSAVLLGFGRLSGDNEVTAIRTSGTSLKNILVPVIVCGFVISLLNIPLNDKILPQSEYGARKLLRRMTVKHPAALLEPGVFIKGFKDYVVFVHGVSGNKLSDIRIYKPSEGEGPTRTVIARKGEIISIPDRNSIKLRLENGSADEIDPKKPEEFYKVAFAEYQMTLSLDDAPGTKTIDKKTREKSVKELLSEIKTMKGMEGADVPLKIELHKKFALAFSNLVFVLVGIPLAIKTHRREKFIGFGFAMGLFLLYWGIMLTGIAFAIRSVVAPWLGVWSANIILVCFAAVLYRKFILE
ncbi:MAG: LptF/LptG family permease [Candidatus Omnitrophica bacterium]|nr:LptF/LptG family permease [Candidatus Omnitrophota bacterium]